MKSRFTALALGGCAALQLAWSAAHRPPEGTVWIATDPPGAAVYQLYQWTHVSQSGRASAGSSATYLGRTPRFSGLAEASLPATLRFQLGGFEPRELLLLSSGFPRYPTVIALKPRWGLLSRAWIGLRDYPLAPVAAWILLAGAAGSWREARRLGRQQRRMQRGDDLAAGDRIHGYRIERLLGRGGMAAVYLAFAEGSTTPVALKVLRRESPWSEIEREVKLSKDLVHPNLVHLMDWGELDGVGYLAMEYVEGDTLEARLGTLSVGLALDWAEQLARALLALHERGIVHRDLKPSNVLVTPEGQVRLMDFGIARQNQATLRLEGTPGYVAPEVVAGRGCDWRADSYALGMVLYAMLAGRGPFQGLPAVQVMRKQLAGEISPLPGLEAPIQALLDRLLQVDPLLRGPEPLDDLQEIRRQLQI